jgi:hypothetical protein
MAVTRRSRSVQFTASGDAVTDFLKVAGLYFDGTGLTAGQQVIIRDGNNDIVATYTVMAANDSSTNLLAECQKMRGLNVTGTIGGTWTVTARLV